MPARRKSFIYALRWLFLGILVLCVFYFQFGAQLFQPNNMLHLCVGPKPVRDVFVPRLENDTELEEFYVEFLQGPEDFVDACWMHMSDILPGKFSRFVLYSRAVTVFDNGSVALGAKMLLNTSSCAAVGSSPQLLEQNFGQEIDQHSVVLRVNFAPVDRFAVHVGRKTSVNYATASAVLDYASALAQRKEHAVDLEKSFRGIPGLVPCGSLQLKMPIASLLRFNNTACFGLDRADGSAVEYSVYNRLYHALQQLRDKQFLGTAVKHSTPTSGLLAAIMMAHVCESVDLYGFGYPQSAQYRRQYNYYDTYSVVDILVHSGVLAGGHDYRVDHALLRLLHHRGAFRLH